MIIIVSVIGSSILHIIFSIILDNNMYSNYMNTCSVGFSAVFFTLKVRLFSNQTNRYTDYWVFNISTKYLAWSLLGLQVLEGFFLGASVEDSAGLMLLPADWSGGPILPRAGERACE